MAGLAQLQHEAYTAVCRAFYAQASLGWDQEDVLTKLREFWNISNQTHSTITQEMRSDPDVVAVRSGGMPSRGLVRTKTGVPAPAPSIGGSLAAQPSFRRAPSRPAGGGGLGTPLGSMGGGGAGVPGVGMGAGGMMPRSASGMQRSRSTRQNGGYGGTADPLGYCGRRLWRFWPMETPPWVEGFIQQWDPEKDHYTIVYDPNTRESTEEVFDFASAIEGQDFVVGEYVDMTGVHGSRRQHDKPYISPEALAAPPPPGLLAALAPAPSKKRKSISGAPVPVDAPFENTYLHARLPVAAEDELQQMLAVLDLGTSQTEAQAMGAQAAKQARPDEKGGEKGGRGTNRATIEERGCSDAERAARVLASQLGGGAAGKSGTAESSNGHAT